MYTIDMLLNHKTKTTNFNQALKSIVDAPSQNDIPLDVLCWLIQQSQKKELKNVKLDNPFKLASLFRAKKDVRYYLTAIHSTGEFLEASNGHTYIRINHKVDPGFYSDSGILLPEFNAKFPYVGPKLAEGMTVIESFAFDDGIACFAGEVAVKHWTDKKGHKHAFAEDYIKTMKRLGQSSFDLIEFCGGAMCLKTDFYTAIVMPIRL